MRTALRIPGVSPGTSAFILHLLSVFASAFVTQIAAAGVGNVHSWPALLSLVCAAAAAGVAAAIHLTLGLIPNLNVTLARFLGSSAVTQVFTSALAVFLTTFGGQLAVGASHVTSIGTLYALVVAAIAAAGSACFHYLIGLVPVPAPPAALPAAYSTNVGGATTSFYSSGGTSVYYTVPHAAMEPPAKKTQAKKAPAKKAPAKTTAARKAAPAKKTEK